MNTTLVGAAASGGNPLLIFSLAVSGVVIFVLLALVVWFAKARMKARQLYEGTLEKRLASGAETMQNLKIAVEQLQTKFVENLTGLMQREDFEGYRTEHNREHDRLDDKLADVRERYAELAQRVDAGLKSMSSMLSKLVQIREPLEPKEES